MCFGPACPLEVAADAGVNGCALSGACVCEGDPTPTPTFLKSNPSCGRLLSHPVSQKTQRARNVPSPIITVTAACVPQILT